jgi:decaprenylphospho-beta-D-ribofuranose 2-oxidase
VREFFHPLDGVDHWNRVYGRGGLVQYQCAVPEAESEVVRVILEALQGAGAPSFLTVLKRFGPGNASPLSFPSPGWTLAVDVPARVRGLGAVLDRLDELVVARGGRTYLAKDARTSPATLRRMYPRLDEWAAVRRRADPQGVLVSDLSRRLDL